MCNNNCNHAYIASQLKRLQVQEPYSASIKLFDGQGNSTNQMNITTEQLEAIQQVLKYDSSTLRGVVDVLVKNRLAELMEVLP